MFNLLGAGVYFLVASTALFAASMAGSGRPGDRIHWIGTAALFAGFCASRIFGLEAGLTDLLREGVKAGGGYSERGQWQVPITIALLAILGALAWYFVAKWRKRSPGSRAKAVFISRFAAISLLLFAAVRVASLHAIDKLIYAGGPVRLNYLIDLGLTGTVLAMAVLYAYRTMQRRAGARRCIVR